MVDSKTTNVIFSPFWLSVWATVFSMCWLLPNHYQPWLTFHSDAWTAMGLLCAALVVIWQAPKSALPCHWFAVFSAILALVPSSQAALGLISLTGIAWISTAYMAGFCMAMLIGAQWEFKQPGQLGDGLFLAIGIATLVSVGLALQQWLDIDGLELWKMSGTPVRPHANFGQPNQLGTFLLWGLLAVGWALVRQRISVPVALLMAVFVLFGLALTGSRTAWLGLTMVVVANWIWRKLLPSPRMPLVVTGLGVYFVLCVLCQTWLRSAVLGDMALPPEHLSLASSQHRLAAWAMFVDAVAQRPWLGYGWYQAIPAQMAVAIENPSLFGVFSGTHNLFLDLLIWCGIPIGLLISFALVIWAWLTVKNIRHPEELILLLLLGVVANHAMLELPLHYAYFLLPVGLVMGALNLRLDGSPVFFMARWLNLSMWLALALLLVLIVRDYARVEPSHENFRMEKMRIKVAHMDAPDVLLLTQWRDFIEVSRIEPQPGMSPQVIDQMRHVTNFFAGPFLIHKLATVLALNHQPDEAKLWLRRLCKSAPDQDCTDARNLWAKQSLKYPEIAGIPWD